MVIHYKMDNEMIFEKKIILDHEPSLARLTKGQRLKVHDMKRFMFLVLLWVFHAD